MDNFTEEQRDVLAKVEKLLRLAAKNTNENEAASASAKAAELLAAYNLESAEIDITGESSGKRAEEALVGGFYQFERDLWRAIAELNFVWYFSTVKLVPLEERKGRYRRTRYRRQHRLIGKTVNIAATKAMAGYLAQTIERLTKEKLVEFKEHMLGSFAVSFRRGVAERICEKINRRRWEQLDAEEKRVQEAAEKAREEGSNVSTALTLSTVKEREEEGNYDFVHGKGAWAERRRRDAEWQQRRAAARAEAEAEYTAWAAAHPEEAKKAEAKRIANARRRTGRSYSAPAFKGDWHAYSLGRKAGENVGINPQTAGRSSKGELL